LDFLRHFAEAMAQQPAALLTFLDLRLFRAVVDDFRLRPTSDDLPTSIAASGSPAANVRM
jgi:hypothetical protein